MFVYGLPCKCGNWLICEYITLVEDTYETTYVRPDSSDTPTTTFFKHGNCSITHISYSYGRNTYLFCTKCKSRYKISSFIKGEPIEVKNK